MLNTGGRGIVRWAGRGGPPAHGTRNGPDVPANTTTDLTRAQWTEWRAALLRFVQSRVADADSAEDIVHEVLLRAHAHLGALKDGDRLAAWLHRIARNAITDHYRSRRPAEPLPADLADETPSPDLRARLSQCLVPLIRHLPDGQRDAVLLSEIDGLTQQETADRLGLSLSGAKSRVQRGRARLAGLLEECCRIETDGRGGIVEFERRPTSPFPACDGCAPDATP